MTRPIFQRRHYEAIAHTLKGAATLNSDAADALETNAAELAEMFEKDNPQFNSSRFLQACGVN